MGSENWAQLIILEDRTVSGWAIPPALTFPLYCFSMHLHTDTRHTDTHMGWRETDRYGEKERQTNTQNAAVVQSVRDYLCFFLNQKLDLRNWPPAATQAGSLRQWLSPSAACSHLPKTSGIRAGPEALQQVWTRVPSRELLEAFGQPVLGFELWLAKWKNSLFHNNFNMFGSD